MSILRVGLTGGIASGKSSASKIFAQLSVPVIDADRIARDQLAANSPLLGSIRQKFGNHLISSDGILDRKALARIVFNSPADLQWLNQLIHPLVSEEVNRQLNLLSSPYVILDIPLLIDKSGRIPSHLSALIDRVLVIDVAESTQIARLCKRDNIDQELAMSIISSQSTREQKLALADDIVDNSGTIEQLESQVGLLHNQYLELSRARNARD